jgi:hypothetical protein
MIKKISISFFQTSSVILFILTLFSPGISRYINSSDSLSINIIYLTIILLLNPIVFLGYYKISIENNLNNFAKKCLIFAITLFLVLLTNNILLFFYKSDEILKDPILLIPNIILGLSTIYFSLGLFKIKIFNDKKTIFFGIISLVTGIFIISVILFPLVFIARWFFYGAASYYLYARKDRV